MSTYYVKTFSSMTNYPLEEWTESIVEDVEEDKEELTFPLTNYGYIEDILIFELDLCGFKKENIKISYVGNLITVNASWDSVKSDTDEITIYSFNHCMHKHNHLMPFRHIHTHNNGCKCKCNDGCKCNKDCKCREEEKDIKDIPIQYVSKGFEKQNYTRKFYLTEDYFGSSIQVTFENGLLTIYVIPNKENVTSNVSISENDIDIKVKSCKCKCD